MTKVITLGLVIFFDGGSTFHDDCLPYNHCKEKSLIDIDDLATSSTVVDTS